MPASVVQPGQVGLTGPITKRDLRLVNADTRMVQFSSLPSERELELIATAIARHPQCALRAYASYDGSIRDLGWLRHFPTLRRFSADAMFELESIDGLRHLPTDLEELTLGRTRRQLSLRPLERFVGLRQLYIEGHTKDIGVLGELRSIEDLTLRSITLPNLELLQPLDRLRSLDIKLGGTTELRPVNEFERLEYLELWMIRGFQDLSPVSELANLRYLFLQALKQVRKLPDLSRCARLERIHIETLKSLTDLQPLRRAARLTDLLLIDMAQLRWAHVACLKDHPSLERLRLGTGSRRRNEEFRARLGYPDVLD